MEVSLWHGFSSNHSAAFTVVGVFRSAEAAQTAFNNLKQLLASIVDWLQQPENAEAFQLWNDSALGAATPPEMQFAKQHGIDWGPDTLDWVADYAYEPNIVQLVENMVFIDGSQSGQGAYPSDSIIASLGGQPLIDGCLGPDNGIALTVGEVTYFVTCLAPDSNTACKIQADALRVIGENIIDGIVHTDDQRVNFEGLSPSNAPHALATLLAYLSEQGCMEIEVMPVEHRSVLY